MSDLRATTLIEENYPPVRRNTVSGFIPTNHNNFSHNFTFFDHRETSPLRRNSSLKESEELIASHYKKIHSIIDLVDQHITRRLQNHQNQVFSIVKEEIEEMRTQTQEIVHKLNLAIADKNTQDEIWILNNELDYFKSQTFKLFEMNKKLRQQVKDQKKKMQEYEIQLQNNDRLMQKLKKRCMKQKMVKDKLNASIKEKINRLSETKLDFNPEEIQLAFNKCVKKRKISQYKGQYSKKQNIPLDLEQEINKRLNEVEQLKNKQKSMVIITMHEQDQMSIAPNSIQVQNIQTSKNSSNKKQKSQISVIAKSATARKEQNAFKIHKIQNYQLKNNDRYQNKSVQTQFQLATSPSYNKYQISTHQKTSQKRIDFQKNGFFINSYNEKGKEKEKEKRMKTQPSMTKNKQTFLNQKRSKHMIVVLNKSKMRYQQTQARLSMNKTSKS